MRLFLLLLTVGVAVTAAAERPPNIVLIVADDLGWTDTSVYGSEYYETPHIDALARQGMRFTQAYASPNCAPTRAALMSGRYAPRTGIYTVGSGARGLEKFRKMIPVENRTELRLEEVTLAETLQSAGYRTAHIGKWHLGSDGHLPTDQGFGVNIAGYESGSPPKGGYSSPYHCPHLEDGPEGEYLTDRLSREAVGFIETNRERPFFLYMCFYSVHTPIEGRPDLVEKWKGKPASGGHNNPEYAAMINSLDDGVGRIVGAIDNGGLADDTIVLFYSDNGGVGGYHRAGVESRDITDNAPLRGGKGMLYEGGVRVPLIVRYPGVTEPGSLCEEPVINVDFYPTLVEIAGARLPKRPLDGTSFLDLLHGEEKPGDRPPLYWHFPGYLQGSQDIGAWRTTPAGAIREGDYKLIEFFETGRTELYDISDDIGEQHDLADEEPVKRAELWNKMKAWRSAVEARLPVPK